MSTKSTIVALPGYCSIDIDADLNVNEDAKLGEGGTATIYKCTFKKMSLITKYKFNEVAVKVIKTDDETTINLIKFEIAIMSSINPHPNVILFVGYSESPIAIVMKYYSMSLKDTLKQFSFAGSDVHLFKIAFDISAGMAHIHQSGVLHLDLKPRKNICRPKSQVYNLLW